MMKRFYLPLASFFLAGMCLLAVEDIFKGQRPQAAIMFLAACLLVLFGVGLLWRRAAFALAAIAAYIIIGPPLRAGLPDTFGYWALVQLALPTVLILSALGLDELLKRRATRVRYIRTNVRTDA